jgi:hypothetical protein
MVEPIDAPHAVDAQTKAAGTISTWIHRIFFGLGVGLLTLNVLGLVLPLRSPLLDSEHSPIPPDEKSTATAADVIRAANADVSRSALLRNLTGELHNYIVHVWPDDPETAAAVHAHVPARENYLLWLAGHLYADYSRYEFTDGERGLRRGVGLCSQQVIILVHLLAERGIPARLQRLGGHVVATAAIDESHWWTLDPDFGVVIEHDIPAISIQPHLVRAAYSKKGLSKAKVNDLAAIYGLKGNFAFQSAKDFAPSDYARERLAYRLKWLIPLVLCLPLVLAAIPKRSSDRTDALQRDP